jgi:6-O-methylguanine DNA methyltransferase, DNA binding domain
MLSNKSAKSWREKLEKDIRPKVVNVPERWAKRIGHGKMLVPSPLLVDTVIKRIARGKLATVNNIRDYLADKFNADMSCPLTTGIFINIAAHTAEEDITKGKTTITPYWRVLKEGGFLNPKFPGGVNRQANYLKQEGFEIIKGEKDGKLYVKDYSKKIAPFIINRTHLSTFAA